MLDVAGWAKPWNTSDIRELNEAMARVGDPTARRMSGAYEEERRP
jgi:hypothetical protein